MTPDLRACSPYFRSPGALVPNGEYVLPARTRSPLADKVMKNLLDRERGRTKKPVRSERSSRKTQGGSVLSGRPAVSARL